MDPSKHLKQEHALLSADDVAHQLKVSRSKAYHMMRCGEIPIVKIGRCVRVRQMEVDIYLLKNTFFIVDQEN